MSRHIEKHVRVLRRRVFGAVWRRKTHHHHERLVVKVLFRLAQKTNRIVCDQIRIVVCLVVVAVFDLKGDETVKDLNKRIAVRNLNTFCPLKLMV